MRIRFVLKNCKFLKQILVYWFFLFFGETYTDSRVKKKFYQVNTFLHDKCFANLSSLNFEPHWIHNSYKENVQNIVG